MLTEPSFASPQFSTLITKAEFKDSLKEGIDMMQKQKTLQRAGSVLSDDGSLSSSSRSFGGSVQEGRALRDATDPPLLNRYHSSDASQRPDHWIPISEHDPPMRADSLGDPLIWRSSSVQSHIDDTIAEVLEATKHTQRY